MVGFPETFHLAPKRELKLSCNSKVVWLPYFAGWITVLPIENLPILTGQMTGCILARFTLGNKQYLAHIGTDSNSVENTKLVKADWTKAADSNAMTPLRAWKPTSDFNLEKIGQLTGGSSYVFGGATAHESFSLLAMYRAQGKDSKLEAGQAYSDLTIETVSQSKPVEGTKCVEVLAG